MDPVGTTVLGTANSVIETRDCAGYTTVHGDGRHGGAHAVVTHLPVHASDDAEHAAMEVPRLTFWESCPYVRTVDATNRYK